MPWHLFLDESGDLGFDFVEKYPSRFLTISVLAVRAPQAVNAIRRAVRKTLDRKVNKRRQHHKLELKGTSTAISVKRYFYDLVANEEFGVYALSLNKARVRAQLCSNAITKDRLYNYIARRVLDAVPLEMTADSVALVIDKSKGKKSIADFDQYLVTQLKGRLEPTAKLSIVHRDSKTDHGLSAADLFCWGIFRKRERGDREWFDVYAKKVLLDDQYL